jgi:hypothetical protein
MVSQTTLKAYDFETIEDYFEYIIISKINGQHSQVLSLIKAMSKEQKKNCLYYFNNSPANNEHVQYCKTVLINQL